MSPEASIDLIYGSDHAPVTFSCNLPNAPVPGWTWRLNDNLLKDPLCKSEISRAIDEFLEIHSADITSLPIQWETLKCVLRGIFIKHGSRLKKERSHIINKLLIQITSLEASHKANPSPIIFSELSKNRQELLHLIDQKYLIYRDKIRKTYYQHDSKCGRLLSRQIHPRTTRTHIHSITQQDGRQSSRISDISQEFVRFYSRLYNIKSNTNRSTKEHLLVRINKYIQDTPLPTITEEETQSLESPFTEIELSTAIKNLPSGSPGLNYVTLHLPLQQASLFQKKVYPWTDARKDLLHSLFPVLGYITWCYLHLFQITARGKELNPLCGETLPAEIDTLSNKVDIVFTTDSSGHHTGWKLQYTTKALPCPDPTLPPRGRFTPEKKTYVVKDQLSVSCERGFVLIENDRTVDSFTTLCLSNGQWDKAMPTCAIVDCGIPNSIENGTFSFVTRIDVTSYDSVIQYQCSGPFYTIDSPGRYQCGSKGDWEDIITRKKELPTCIADCGNRVPRPLKRIIGGSVARLGEFPWQTLINTNPGSGGGALLYDNWVITAAHVLYNVDISRIFMKMGFISKNETNFYRALPESIFIHPDYREDGTYNHDIALIKLKSKVPINEYLLGICLPTKKDSLWFSSDANEPLTGLVSGWGITERQIPSRHLRYVQVDVIAHDKCIASYNQKSTSAKQYTVTENMICAGDEEGGKDACGGDSGGALVFYDLQNNKWFIGGIVSWGLECGAIGQYGVYTKVSNYLDWIYNLVQNN
ncbi:mannan-binding lectin serine protease 2-like [Hyperolius riggenbachi]|uniref:mannan-binding lectin serine protease 2-like n=1 Tax=Hyperolius riggenbachi TaxID=752182 RepID=UPI0035A2CEA0